MMMMKELLQQQQEQQQQKQQKLFHNQDVQVELPELTLGLLRCGGVLKQEQEQEPIETSSKKKRKFCFEQSNNDSVIQSIELQVNESLPLDWEQCLDLQSGRVYYFNRKTLKKSWKWPKDQKLDLELNISTPSSTTDEFEFMSRETSTTKQVFPPSSNMVAVACMKCHLLVMLCRSSPSCPNCKYVNTLLPPQQTLQPFKTFNTLSLLN